MLFDNEEKWISSSFLRLVQDDNPGVEQEPMMTSYHELRQFIKDVISDLELLLNSRTNLTYVTGRERGHENNSSDLLIRYGMEDFTHININSIAGKEELCARVESVINQNEPRLSDTKVSLVDARGSGGSFKFLIEAKINISVESDKININASFESGSQRISLNNVL